MQETAYAPFFYTPPFHPHGRRNCTQELGTGKQHCHRRSSSRSNLLLRCTKEQGRSRTKALEDKVQPQQQLLPLEQWLISTFFSASPNHYKHVKISAIALIKMVFDSGSEVCGKTTDTSLSRLCMRVQVAISK